MARKSDYELLRGFLAENHNNYISGANKMFYKWNDKFYNEYYDSEVKRDIINYLNSKGEDCNTSRVTSMFKMMTDLTMVRMEELNMKQDEIVVFNNGSYNLKSETFHRNKMEKSLHRTSIIRHDYVEGASYMPNFKMFLETTMEGDHERIAILQELLGYLLTSSCRLEKAFLLYGDGGTGKSTFLDIITKIIGKESVSNVPLNELNLPFSRATIYGKRINMCNEFENKLGDTSSFKEMVSGQMVKASFKFKDEFSFQNTAKFIFAMNNLSVINDRTDGIYRRLVIIPFNYSFTKNKVQDVHFLKKIEDEYSAIISWGIEGYHRLMENKEFSDSKVCDAILKSYRQDNDPISMFIEDCLEIDNSVTMGATKEAIMSSYNKWCDGNNFRKMNNVNFFKNFVRITKIEDKRVSVNGTRVRIKPGVMVV